MQKLVFNFFEFSQFDLSVSLLRNLIQWFITLFLNTWWLDKYDIILKGEIKCHPANVFLTQITMAIHIILVPYKSDQELISPLTLLTSIIQNYTLTPAFTWRKGECTVIGFAQSFYLKSNTFPVIKLWNNFSCALWVWNNLVNNQTIKIIIRKWAEIVFHKNKRIESLMLHQKRTKHGCCRQMECGLIEHQYMHWIINVN